jgi:hypothetical protein
MNVDVYSVSFKILLLGIAIIFYIFIFRELLKAIVAHLFAGITPLPILINIFMVILSSLVPLFLSNGKIFTITSSEIYGMIPLEALVAAIKTSFKADTFKSDQILEKKLFE